MIPCEHLPQPASRRGQKQIERVIGGVRSGLAQEQVDLPFAPHLWPAMPSARAFGQVSGVLADQLAPLGVSECLVQKPVEMMGRGRRESTTLQTRIEGFQRP